MVERANEHGRHAVERGAAFLGHRLKNGERIEGLGRIDERRAVRQRAEIGHHHAEAMVERHWHANLVLLGQPDRLADEEAIVENVAVGERRAFRIARRARSELDVDRLVRLQRRAERGEAILFGV